MGVAGWIGSIVAAVLATTLIDLMMSEGETKKFVKGIASLLVIAVIIAPLPSLIDGNFKLTGGGVTEQPSDYETNDDYLERVYLARYKAYELAIQNKLTACGMSEVIVRIEIAYNAGEVTIEAVNVDLSGMVLTGGTANIDSSKEVFSAVTGVLGKDAASKIVMKRGSDGKSDS